MKLNDIMIIMSIFKIYSIFSLISLISLFYKIRYIGRTPHNNIFVDVHALKMQ